MIWTLKKYKGVYWLKLSSINITESFNHTVMNFLMESLQHSVYLAVSCLFLYQFRKNAINYKAYYECYNEYHYASSPSMCIDYIKSIYFSNTTDTNDNCNWNYCIKTPLNHWVYCGMFCRDITDFVGYPFWKNKWSVYQDGKFKQP